MNGSAVAAYEERARNLEWLRRWKEAGEAWEFVAKRNCCKAKNDTQQYFRVISPRSMKFGEIGIWIAERPGRETQGLLLRRDFRRAGHGGRAFRHRFRGAGDRIGEIIIAHRRLEGIGRNGSGLADL